MTYRLPTLNGLRAFEAAARHLSFKIAASELGVTPGAIGQQVKKLEATLGVALFKRLPNGLLLTREGEIYHPQISRAFEDLTNATETIAPDLNARKFTLGLCPAAVTILPANWPRTSDALASHVRDVRITDNLDLLLDNTLDCLVGAGKGPFDGLSSVEIARGCGPESAMELHYICRNGLINCRQSQAIIEDLSACLG